MPRRPANKGRKGPTPVESIRHQDARPNIPTADMHEQVPTQVEAPVTLKYPRNADLDPQLVWRGKDSQDLADLRVDAPPIYIQEKIDPAVLIENLRDTANAGEIEPELTLFEGFDGLPQSDLVDFYQHSANWSNRMILGDSLQVMASLAEREMLRGKVQMIYMDPPYGIKFGSNWQVSARQRSVSDGNLAEFANEPEVVKAFRDTWELGIHSYLSYLRDRLTLSRDLLTTSGSIFLQIGDENVHLVRNLLDEIFGSENFISQISFRTTAPLSEKFLPGITNYLLWYGRNKKETFYRQLWTEKKSGFDSNYSHVEDEKGNRRRLRDSDFDDESQLLDGLRLFYPSPFLSSGYTATCTYSFQLDGRTIPANEKSWRTTPEGAKRLISAGRLTLNSAGRPVYVAYFEDWPMQPINDLWTDTRSPMKKRYVVQTDTEIIKRALVMTTKPGDLVLDPTCGSGTTASVAEQFGRRWITIDSSRVALTLAKERLATSTFPYYILRDSPEGDLIHRTRLSLTENSHKTTFANDVRLDFVYSEVPHVTLENIANNERIVEGISRTDATRIISEGSDSESLRDLPITDSKRVRVSGPFTVESLTPHRSLELPFADSSAPEPKGTVDGIEFDQVILQNVRTAGIQNGLRKERIEFADLTVHAGKYIQGVGTPKEGGENKVAIAVGPQYGTVSPQWIQSAAVEAKTIPGVKVLAVLGFAFDPQVRAVTDQYEANDSGIDTVGELPLGKLRVLMVRMNPDLLMGRDLRKTASANLFMVFGEPEIIWKRDDEKIVVEVKGVDVYDPIKDEIRSRSTDQIYLWMIDSNYDGKSFFMRHCYFLGEQEPYEKLKRDLKADIDEEVWETLYKTTSRPFDPPSTGRIAVKVINDYGDEAMKVIEIK
jgi:adenine-specific DNA-methyltransferase